MQKQPRTRVEAQITKKKETVKRKKSENKKYHRTTRNKVLLILGILFLMVVLFTIGVMIGYSVLGEGEATDVFSPRVWENLRVFFE